MRAVIRPLAAIAAFTISLLVVNPAAADDTDAQADADDGGVDGTASQTDDGEGQSVGSQEDTGSGSDVVCWNDGLYHTTQGEQLNDIREEETAGREGEWGWRVCNDGRPPELVFWPAEEQVDPETLARSVRLTPPVPLVHANPALERPQVVDIESWFWIAPGSWGPHSKPAEAGSVWVEVTITPQTLVIDPGDGSGEIECPGGGTPYDTGRSADSQSSGCTHVYESAGDYTATATVVYSASWTSNVDQAGGELGNITSPANSFEVQVAEGQAIVTD